MGHHWAWSLTTYGLLVFAASTAEITGTVGLVFPRYITQATAISETAKEVTTRSAFLIKSYSTNVATFCLANAGVEPRRAASRFYRRTGTGAVGAELDVRGFEITVDNALHVPASRPVAICFAMGGASSTRIGAFSIRFGRRETVNEFRQL